LTYVWFLACRADHSWRASQRLDAPSVFAVVVLLAAGVVTLADAGFAAMVAVDESETTGLLPAAQPASARSASPARPAIGRKVDFAGSKASAIAAGRQPCACGKIFGAPAGRSEVAGLSSWPR
jgi:hypothetical protein